MPKSRCHNITMQARFTNISLSCVLSIPPCSSPMWEVLVGGGYWGSPQTIGASSGSLEKMRVGLQFWARANPKGMIVQNG